jgi:WS/DGAT/MGAT family acyltransferase
MMSLTDGGCAPPKRQQQPRDDRDWLTDSLLRPIAELAVKAIAAAGSGVAKSVDASHHPLDASVDMARIGYQAVNDLAALAFMPDDSATRLKGKPGSEKRVAWSNDLPLDAVKAVGKGLGASINDVLLSCVAGAIGSYLRSKGEAVTAKQIRAMVPVNLRPPAHSYQLGNRFGLVPLLLPIGIENPVERLYAVRASMRELKGSFQPVLAFGLLAVAGLLIKPVQTAMLNLFAKKATAVMTNVPGPTEPLQLLGSQVERLMFWVPQSGDIGVGVSILTYAGRVQFGLIADSILCPDPQGIIDRFEPEFNQLLLLTLMLPWE